MRSILLFWLIAITSIAHAAENLVIENVTVISPHFTQLQPAQHVLIVDGRIRRISQSSIETDDATERLDGTGKYLTPGIMDAHVHVSLIPGLGFSVEEKAEQNVKLVDDYFRQQPRSHLYHGVTQILDPNPGTSWERFEAAPQHPDLFRCEVITSPETFPFVAMPENIARKLYPYYVLESGVADDVDTNNQPRQRSPEALVARIAQSGASCIKLYFEDGYGDNSQWPLLSTDTVDRVRRSAISHGLPVLAHANAFDMYEVAIRSEVDVIVHGAWNWGSDNNAQAVPQELKTIGMRLREQQISVMPTLRVMAGLAELMLPETLKNPAFSKVTPTSLLDWYESADAQWFKAEVIADFGGDLTADDIATIINHGISRRGNRAMVYLHQTGHVLLLGSDYPGSASFANQPGLTTYQEMHLMAEAGIPLGDILAAATVNNARQFNLSTDYGTIENGKIANMLLLREDPLKDIEAWNSIEIVILHGVPIRRETLAVVDER